MHVLGLATGAFGAVMPADVVDRGVGDRPLLNIETADCPDGGGELQLEPVETSVFRRSH